MAHTSKWTVKTLMEIKVLMTQSSESSLSLLFYKLNYQGSHGPWKSLSWNFDKKKIYIY